MQTNTIAPSRDTRATWPRHSCRNARYSSPAHLATGERKLTMLGAPAAPHVADDGNVEWGIREGHPRLPACHQPIDITG